METVEEVLASLNKQNETFTILSSAFAITTSETKNAIVDVQLMGRNNKYTDCLVLSYENIGKDVKGVLLFVGISKYPVFIPFFYGNQNSNNMNNDNSIKLQSNTSQDKDKSFVILTDDGNLEIVSYLKI